MHPYWDQAIINERADTLRRQADRHRLVATAAIDPADLLSARFRKRFDALLALVSGRGPQPQPCMC